MKILFKNGTKVRVNQKAANLVADAMKQATMDKTSVVTLNEVGKKDILLLVNLNDVSAIV